MYAVHLNVLTHNTLLIISKTCIVNKNNSNTFVTTGIIEQILKESELDDDVIDSILEHIQKDIVNIKKLFVNNTAVITREFSINRNRNITVTFRIEIPEVVAFCGKILELQVVIPKGFEPLELITLDENENRKHGVIWDSATDKKLLLLGQLFDHINTDLEKDINRIYIVRNNKKEILSIVNNINNISSYSIFDFIDEVVY
ncbi:MAG: hypothetical protein [Bacteriophage sp.]|nr:MAG: hypothetical protein [Bacteriophage sp.]